MPKILIVDDNRDAVVAIQCLLELYGHETVVAYDGESGLSKARECGPDLVLCDIGLPGRADGYTVAAELREQQRFANTPLIAVTGYGSPGDVERSRHAGFDMHLTKPVDAATLYRVITEKLGPAAGEEPAARPAPRNH